MASVEKRSICYFASLYSQKLQLESLDIVLHELKCFINFRVAQSLTNAINKNKRSSGEAFSEGRDKSAMVDIVKRGSEGRQRLHCHVRS